MAKSHISNRASGVSTLQAFNVDTSKETDSISNDRQCYTFLSYITIILCHEKRCLLRRFGNNKGHTAHNRHTRLHRSTVFRKIGV